MKIAVNPSRASKFCKQAATRYTYGSRPSVVAMTSTQCYSYHSTSTVGNTSTGGEGLSSLRDIDFGYKVSPINTTNNNRAYTTSIMTTTAGEDYDEYTLHNMPSESTQCDLGVLYPSDDASGLVLLSDEEGSEYRFTEYDATIDNNDEWNLNLKEPETERQRPGQEVQDGHHTEAI